MCEEKVEMELPNHAKQLMLQLNQQRAKGFLCDVIIVVENALFRAHKNILAASSIYLKSLVLHDNLINLDTEMVNPSIFRQILDFIYTGKLLSTDQASEQNFNALLTAASYLQLHDLAALCRKKLKRSGKALPSKLSSPCVNRLVRSQRLSSTPVAQNCFSGSVECGKKPADESLKDKLSDDELFIGGPLHKGSVNSLQCSAGQNGSNGNISSGSAGDQELGLDLSKKSPSASTATEEVARKKEWPKREVGSKGEERAVPNGVIVAPRTGEHHLSGRGSSAGGGGGSSSSFASDHSFQCKEEEDVENGHSEDSGQSDGESSHPSANYVYRQEGFEAAFGDNLYVCIPCGKGFPSSEQLNAHVESHTEEELYIKEEGTYVKEEDGEEAEDLSATVAPASFGSESRPFKCTVCTKSYKDPATLRQHEKTHWLSRPFPCNICGKIGHAGNNFVAAVHPTPRPRRRNYARGAQTPAVWGKSRVLRWELGVVCCCAVVEVVLVVSPTHASCLLSFDVSRTTVKL
ncbi:Hypermethylated in cancer 2 protein-like [Scleropages formosus]|uniref:Hypermethylated in cancer 2 protein-like n=1 Tax=Scleropages formosus TaxID=113540 RepID=A0A0P7UN60_SCLFO|nr:Hypermethylated in cancer 2 protein-like [Scleropages formosus]